MKQQHALFLMEKLFANLIIYGTFHWQTSFSHSKFFINYLLDRFKFVHLRLSSLHSTKIYKDNPMRHAEISLSRINSIDKHAIILSLFFSLFQLDCLYLNVPNVINHFQKMIYLFVQHFIEDFILIVFVVIIAIVYLHQAMNIIFIDKMKYYVDNIFNNYH
jgi:hypothetical protein